MGKVGETEQFIHPLESFVNAVLDKEPWIDVWVLAPLLGSPSRPPTGVRAYEIVAQDILEVITCRGVLIRRGNKPKGIRPGGCSYERAIQLRPNQ